VFEAVFPRRGDFGIVAFVLENPVQGSTDAGLVVDDQDSCQTGRSTMKRAPAGLDSAPM
jgi:hypothetical protein